ncbi:hypothetical protein [Pelovirga terrestris]|uniref:DUF4019 domain-containing protein n=1 Tax=Pelovirga terrestris TaxID=2771352 RepID=A0A8J6QQ08_9BACT|nr:hypothetical protein [Pelovirga terrestris]MBD1400781.1 hypothetical protein [Pelovirga terrestris]
MRRFSLLLFASVCLLLSGCAALTGGETANLPQIAERFTESMRWKDWYGAAKFVETEQRSAFLEQFREDPDLFVVDSQIQNIQPGARDGAAEVVYLLDYYRLPSSRIERWTWVQQWQKQPGRFATEAVWLISNPPPLLPWNR